MRLFWANRANCEQCWTWLWTKSHWRKSENETRKELTEIGRNARTERNISSSVIRRVVARSYRLFWNERCIAVQLILVPKLSNAVLAAIGKGQFSIDVQTISGMFVCFSPSRRMIDTFFYVYIKHCFSKLHEDYYSRFDYEDENQDDAKTISCLHCFCSVERQCRSCSLGNTGILFNFYWALSLMQMQ